jgi:hypothetical protein
MPGTARNRAELNSMNPRTRTRKANGPAISVLEAKLAMPPPIDSKIPVIYPKNVLLDETSDPKTFTAKARPMNNSTIESKRLNMDRNALIVTIIDFYLIVRGIFPLSYFYNLSLVFIFDFDFDCIQGYS